MAIAVYKKCRLVEVNNYKFNPKGLKKEMRTVKIDSMDADEFNRNASTSGILYVLDEESTKERNESLEPKKVIDRDELKAKADELGLEYQNNIKTDKLIELIEQNS